MPKPKPIQVTCPQCAHRFTTTPPRASDWRPKLARFLSFFCEEITPIESQRLIKTGTILRIWTSAPAGYSRLNQIQAEGWIASGGHGWYTLTDKGVAIGRAWIANNGSEVVEEIDNLRPVSVPPTPDRPDAEDQVHEPSEWQRFFLKEFVNYPVLYGLNAVVRYTRKSGFLGKGGTAQIRSLIADGWLTWIDAKTPTPRLVLTYSARRLLLKEGIALPADLPTVNGAPGVND